MSKRWSKLQSRLYNIMDDSIHFQIHCELYEMHSNSEHHGSKLPRYFITIDKEIVFDYPKDCDTMYTYGSEPCPSYPWDGGISKISNLIEEYIQCPESEIMKPFEHDKWGLTNILRVCDKRVGKRRLQGIREYTTNAVLTRIIDKRCG